MNSLGTHDTPRILTLLGTGSTGQDHDRDWRARFRLSPEQRALGVARLKLASLILYTFPGSPTVYYGDEAGMEGFEDPFNRRTYPWGREDRELVDWFAALGKARQGLDCLRRGELRFLRAEGPVLAFSRSVEGQTAVAAVNAGTGWERLVLPWGVQDYFQGRRYPWHRWAGGAVVPLAPMSCRLLVYSTSPGDDTPGRGQAVTCPAAT